MWLYTLESLTIVAITLVMSKYAALLMASPLLRLTKA
jgi:hypothetical protein